MFAVLALSVLLTPTAGQPVEAAPQDAAGTLLRDVLIVDGTGTLPYSGEVLIVGDEIAAVGPAGSLDVSGEVFIENLSGLMLAPGFIDIHNHSDNGVLSQPSAEALISQGETTIIVGPDGAAGAQGAISGRTRQSPIQCTSSSPSPPSSSPPS